MPYEGHFFNRLPHVRTCDNCIPIMIDRLCRRGRSQEFIRDVGTRVLVCEAHNGPSTYTRSARKVREQAIYHDR